MKFLLSLVFSIFQLITLSATDWEYFREHYEKAVTDKALCKSLIEKLSNNTSKTALNQAYLGAFQAVWANHVGNPISKLKTFNKGKDNIEKAIKKSPNNVEIRFLRLSIQKNIPKILGYNQHITADTNFLIKHKNTIQSAKLKEMVERVLKHI